MALMDYIGGPAMLEQTAEEATELAFSCLKLARMIRGENKVHGRTRDELMSNLVEELADVKICTEELISGGLVSDNDISNQVEEKRRRMKLRLRKEGKEKDDQT